MLNVNVMDVIVRNAGNASSKFSHSILVIIVIMKNPIIIRAGAVAAAGIKYASGTNKKETLKIRISVNKEKNHFFFSIKKIIKLECLSEDLKRIFTIFNLNTHEEYEVNGIRLAILKN